MRVCVTGAEGFIGSHLVETLVAAGHQVRATVLYNFRSSRGWLETLPSAVLSEVEVFFGDVRDSGLVWSALQGCDAVLNLAALIGVPYSFRAPRSYFETNVTGAMNVLEAARAHGLTRVVQVSTSEVYGTAQTAPIDEHHPLNAQSPYAASKIAADQLSLSFWRAYGVPVTVIRPFNTFGPRQSNRAVIPTIITQIADGMRRIELGALAPTRDFTFVTDTARGLAAGLSAGDSCLGECINLGTGFEIAIGDLALLIAEIMGVEIEVVSQAERIRPGSSEVERLLADNRKAASLLGWQPEMAGREGLRRGLAETVAWFSRPENVALYRADAYTV